MQLYKLINPKKKMNKGVVDNVIGKLNDVGQSVKSQIQKFTKDKKNKL